MALTELDSSNGNSTTFNLSFKTHLNGTFTHFLTITLTQTLTYPEIINGLGASTDNPK
jgi:hypothetical protein